MNLTQIVSELSSKYETLVKPDVDKNEPTPQSRLAVIEICLTIRDYGTYFGRDNAERSLYSDADKIYQSILRGKIPSRSDLKKFEESLSNANGADILHVKQ